MFDFWWYFILWVVLCTRKWTSVMFSILCFRDEQFAIIEY